VRGRRSHPAAGLAIACAIAAFADGAVASPPAASAAAPAPIDQKKACLECHGDLAAELERPVAHPPVKQGNCTACHNPHVSRFSALLKEAPGPVCLTCHAGVGREVARAHPHAPAREGRCAACHEPHGGRSRGLLSKTGAALCSSCHAGPAAWIKRPVQHVPFARGQCGTCHEVHGSDSAGMLTRPVASLCGSCHAAGASLRKAHRGYPVEKADCMQCHDPHASTQPGLFRESLHAPFEQGECMACHATPGSPEPFRTRLPVLRLCGECHAEETEAVAGRPFPHLSGGDGACTACHNPHTADGKALLKSVQKDLCLTCHDPGGAKSGQAGRFLSHGDGRECTACHEPHGGSRPLLLAADGVALCSGCHQPQHTVSHPTGETHPDPRNATPMTCLSCHAIHDAPHPKYLVRSGERDLCVGCHRDLAGGR
jgi:predicted CXXCH cytochrome family protein